MIQFGRSIRWFNDYYDEVEFSKRNRFDFLQVWFTKYGIGLDSVPDPKTDLIMKVGYPILIHALLDINEFEEAIPELVEVLKTLQHKEVIIHPVCTSEAVDLRTNAKLCKKVTWAAQVLADEGIGLALENNSRLDQFHYRVHEIAEMFQRNPGVKLLLDIAHIDSYEHLQEIVKVKMPAMLHVADKHFHSVHEHLPLGQGDLDFNYIFNDVLKEFDGKIIFEVTDGNESIIRSKEIVETVLGERVRTKNAND